MSTLVFDVEVYSNFFLALFKDTTTGKLYRFQLSPNTKLDKTGLTKLLESNLVVGFNSRNYDVPMIQLALDGLSTQEIKIASDRIINEGLRVWDLYEMYGLEKPTWNHIDIVEVAPLKGSLKIYAGRLHCDKMQDLPIDPHAEVTHEQARQLFTYCINDLDNTNLLWSELSGQIALRDTLSAEYNQDVRSRSDAQIAEYVIAQEVAKIIGFYPRKPEGVKRSVKYDVPSNVTFMSPRLNMLLDEVREVKFSVDDNGSVKMPDCLNTAIRLGHGAYRMGIGGLHSSEKSVYHVADEHTLLIDRDVASYYPAIILNQELYPMHMGPAFLTVYRSIVERRLAAKKAGNKVVAESLKIVINGGFGKFGSKYSCLYSPQLLIQVTISGQLYLLMLIEMIEASGIEVVSANTDGIVIRCPKSRYSDLEGTIKHWERVTGFTTEETRYRAIYSRDVNNYIAIKEKGGTKGKGAYSNPWEVEGANIFKLHKNPTTTICIEAVCKLLESGVCVTETIRACQDIRKFIAVRSVSGGAKDENGYLGKAIRWYYAKEARGSMSYAKRKAKVSKSEHSKALMELPDKLPDDIDYGWYLAECHSMLNDLGYLQRSLFVA